jgi:transcriptional regulator with XRE-family HTH domain
MGRPAQRERPAYGQHLTGLREAAGLTQQQLAGKLGVHQSNIAFWERWDKPPRGEVLPKLAQALSVSVDVLLGVTPPKLKRQAAKGRLQLVFESASKLPRRQQEKVAEFVEAFVNQHSKAA